MIETDILIIGGGIAGTTAAETFRAGNPDASVTIVSDEKHPLYSRVLLPHAVKGKIEDGKAFLKEVGFYDASGLAYVTGKRVTEVDPERKVAVLNDGSEIRFGKLVIATGGRVRVWKVPGSGLEGIVRLQTYEDISAIRKRLEKGGEMVIVGAGFIALEFASFAVHAGMKATVVNRGTHLNASVFGPLMAAEARGILEGHGIDVIDGAEVERVLGDEAVSGVRLKDGREIACALIGLGIGLDLNTGPFGKIGTASGVLADATLRTSHPDIWVAGDCAEFEDTLLGFRHIAGNWTNAAAQGLHVGRALLGEEGPYEQLTAYTSRCVPGMSLIHLGETRLRDGFEREERVIETGKAVGITKKDGRIVGAVLLNVPEHRSALAEAVEARSEAALRDLLNDSD